MLTDILCCPIYELYAIMLIESLSDVAEDLMIAANKQTSSGVSAQ